MKRRILVYRSGAMVAIAAAFLLGAYFPYVSPFLLFLPVIGVVSLLFGSVIVSPVKTKVIVFWLGAPAWFFTSGMALGIMAERGGTDKGVVFLTGLLCVGYIHYKAGSASLVGRMRGSKIEIKALLPFGGDDNR